MKTTAKNIKLLILLAGMCFGFGQTGNAQIQYPFQNDTTPFVGKWIASSGNRTFELILTEHRHYPDKSKKDFMDMLIGEMIYKTDGEVIRHIKTDGYKSIFGGTIPQPAEVSFLFTDYERKIAGNGQMTLDPSNPKKAVWKLYRGDRFVSQEGWGKVDFDIPKELEWTKVE